MRKIDKHLLFERHLITPINLMKVRISVRMCIYKFTKLCSMKSYTWSRGTAYSAQYGGGWSKPRPSRLNQGKDSVPIVQEVGWSQGPVWAGEGNSRPTEVRSSNRPSCTVPLYRLRCPNYIYLFIYARIFIIPLLNPGGQKVMRKCKDLKY
jgi:hypothetical protein